jgi:hypothetical protein
MTRGDIGGIICVVAALGAFGYFFWTVGREG